jgi:hypothetical protein
MTGRLGSGVIREDLLLAEHPGQPALGGGGEGGPTWHRAR